MPLWYYHYTNDTTEINQIQTERKIASAALAANPLTWYSPTRYDNTANAQQDLSLPTAPTHRVGPIPDPVMPTLHTPLQVVVPKNGQPGGGLEAATQDEVWLSGLWDFGGSRWDF